MEYNERTYSKDGKSELRRLLVKHSTGKALSSYEFRRVEELLSDPIPGDDDCLLCDEEDPNPSIYDTGFCEGHFKRVFNSRK